MDAIYLAYFIIVFLPLENDLINKCIVHIDQIILLDRNLHIIVKKMQAHFISYSCKVETFLQAGGGGVTEL